MLAEQCVFDCVLFVVLLQTLSKESAGVLIFSAGHRREPDIGIKPFWHVAPNEHHIVHLMWYTSKRPFAQAAVWISSGVCSQGPLRACVCVFVHMEQHLPEELKHRLFTFAAQIQPKTKNHPYFKKIYTCPNIFIYHTCTLCTGLPPQLISQACKMCCLFMLKHGPKRSLILSRSLSIHLFPLSRRYQLEETDVSSCYTSWLNFFALWCLFFEWRPVSLCEEMP